MVLAVEVILLVEARVQSSLLANFKRLFAKALHKLDESFAGSKQQARLRHCQCATHLLSISPCISTVLS